MFNEKDQAEMTEVQLKPVKFREGFEYLEHNPRIFSPDWNLLIILYRQMPKALHACIIVSKLWNPWSGALKPITGFFCESA